MAAAAVMKAEAERQAEQEKVIHDSPMQASGEDAPVTPAVLDREIALGYHGRIKKLEM